MEDTVYPDSNDVRPLLDVAIDYDQEAEVAKKQVFGKKLLARDLETAAHFSKEFSFSMRSPKMEDVVNRRGRFEGDFATIGPANVGSEKINEAEIVRRIISRNESEGEV